MLLETVNIPAVGISALTAFGILFVLGTSAQAADRTRRTVPTDDGLPIDDVESLKEQRQKRSEAEEQGRIALRIRSSIAKNVNLTSTGLMVEVENLKVCILVFRVGENMLAQVRIDHVDKGEMCLYRYSDMVHKVERYLTTDRLLAKGDKGIQNLIDDLCAFLKSHSLISAKAS